MGARSEQVSGSGVGGRTKPDRGHLRAMDRLVRLRLSEVEIDVLLGILRSVGNEPADCDFETYKALISKVERAIDRTDTKVDR